MSNKRIIFFSRDLKIGGMEKALVCLLNSLQLRNYNITLVLTDKSGELLEQLHPGITVKEYKICNYKFIPLRKCVNVFKRTIWRIINGNKYDFSCNYATYLTIGSKLASIASKNSSLYVHSDYFNYFKGNIKNVKQFFSQQGIKYLKKIIFVSNEALLPIGKIFPEYKNKFLVISNLVEHTQILTLSKQTINDCKPNKELLVFAGRLEESSKRLTRLLTAFKNVCEISCQYELWIVGDGNGFELCKQLISKYNLHHCVKMMGEKANPYPYIKLSDCVILTSDFEGFPVIYNECLALKKPIITTVPVSDNLIDIRNFSIIVDKNPQQISNAILNKEYKKINFNSIDFNMINRKRLDTIESIL